MTHDELIAALEAAEGPSRRLDELIDCEVNWCAPMPDSAEPPHYTASIDAALTLVPGGFQAFCLTVTEAPENPRHKCGVVIAHPFSRDSFGATPAIALCIAALKARKETKS